MKIDKIYIAAALAVLTLLFASGAVKAQTAVSGAGAIAGSAAQSGALAAGNVISIEGSTFPAPLKEVTTKYDGDYTLRNVPNVVVPNVYPTASCTHSSALGGSVAGFGIAGGTSWEAVNCEHRENARILHGMGKVAEGMEALCSQTNAANYSFCKTAVAQPAKKAALEPRSPVVTDAERQRKDAGNLVFDSEGKPWRQTTGGEWIQARLP
jgi:hypothetical protein